MAPVPDSLPEPNIRPAALKPFPAGNLISFAGFDMKLFLARQDGAGSSAHCLGSLSGNRSSDSEQTLSTGQKNMEEEPETFAVHSTVLNMKDEPALGLPNGIATVCEGSLSAGATHSESIAGPSSHCSPGTRFLSQVEAGMLSSARDSSTVANSVDVARSAFTLVTKSLPSEGRDGSAVPYKKMTRPKVRLAANFNFGVTK